ncbi:thioredoxin family protein [Metaclostridioides mangenotii]|uniref:Bacteriocin transport accessory protein n=1 Tax=Metaclostridioides mangenotii TaxID=1540 RepID=A0ABS4E6Z0_9FIRM|nr:thioredoxin family protein [Clostridioides mangenotii]MBP1853704.1 putative bacteriocin transport accessory protein [Clostridioides mangenotii]
MKKYILCIFILLLTVAVVGCTIDSTSKHGELKNIEKLSFFNDLKEKDDEIIIYFGNEECIFCKKFKPILLDVIDEDNKNIYYFNTEKLRNQSMYSDIIESYHIEQIPKLIYLKSNKLIKSQDLIKEGVDLNNNKLVKKKIKIFIN